MATYVRKYIGTNGDVLLPLSETAGNTSSLVSDKGVFYLAQTEEVVAIEAGNPIGLLLTLTYPATL